MEYKHIYNYELSIYGKEKLVAIINTIFKKCGYECNNLAVNLLSELSHYINDCTLDLKNINVIKFEYDTPTLLLNCYSHNIGLRINNDHISITNACYY